MSSDSLGIRARRSKSTRPKSVIKLAVLDHTLDQDLPMIVDLAKKYMEMDEQIRETISKLVFEGKTFEYYYGSYVAAIQIFTIAHMAENELAPSIMAIVHTIAYRIVERLKEAKKEMLNAKNINDVKVTI